ncbi:MAG TPA: hypothetical protein VNA04_00190 [Thermoanaerobaculia bacterium]|nr:hypothetical protein [Thermoanaerobaculia bacterium]
MSDFSARVYRLVFGAAAAYNIVFGLWASLAPQAFFDLFQLPPPRYPLIWACLGMVVGLYGALYAYGAWRLDRAFPLIAIGLAGKVLGPLGWLLAVRSGDFPLRTFPLIVFNDLIWWLPFGLFLLEGTAVKRFLARTAPWWCAALHLVALAGTAVLLRGGSEAVSDLQQRTAWLEAHRGQWRAGWLLWMAAAVSLTGFYAWWGSRVNRRPALVALVIAWFGLMCDFAGESLFIASVPLPDSALYRAATLLTGGAGNALYTLAGVLLTLVTPAMPPLLRRWAWVVWGSGAVLTLATIAGSAAGVVFSSAVLMALFIPWVVLAGMRLR